ncbi:MAG TPA: hypothetical protein PLP83_08395 [Candidatus Aminicenantes bacterium]|nr:hypothetical protein [Candidatus Aminicenantes bacterium]
MNKRILIPAGGILIIICFFLPWVRACNVDITGIQLATDKDFDGALLWLVPLAGLAMLIGYLAVKERARVIAVISSLGGLLLLFIKILGPITKGEARQMGLELQVGGYGTIIGLILALIGGLTTDSKKAVSDKPPDEAEG